MKPIFHIKMITLGIKNFKCFYDVEVPINELTVLAGGNGNGKSTVIQSILLLRRTIEHCSEWKGDHFEYKNINGLNVELNDVYCLGLGNSLNILPSEFKETDIELGLSNCEEIFIQSNTVQIILTERFWDYT
ncbi:MAG: AAA family ATPase [Saprospiraceae bacterium]|nr:AAA family ATPase [Saprospiraceae bacterium]